MNLLPIYPDESFEVGGFLAAFCFFIVWTDLVDVEVRILGPYEQAFCSSMGCHFLLIGCIA